MILLQFELLSQCATMPSGISGCLRAQQTFVAIGDPGNLTDLSAWITSSCILPYSTAQTTSQYIVIIGDINIDVDYYFAAGSEVLIMPGIEINQASGIFIIDSTYIHGCEEMWDKWVLHPASSVFLDSRLRIIDSEISDAIDGFVLHPGSIFGAQRTEFVNNRTSIRTLNTNCNNTQQHYTIWGGICDNVFTAPALLSPYSGQKGEWGIRLISVLGYDIGVSCSGINEFSDLKHGIDACNVGLLNVEKSKFTNIGITSGISGAIRCTGLSGSNASLNQVGLGLLMTPTFENCVTAIQVINSNLSAQNNFVKNSVHNGFVWRNSISRNCAIRNNKIENYGSDAIYFDNNSPNDATIENNHIAKGDFYVPTAFDFGMYIIGNGALNNSQNLRVNLNSLRNEKIAMPSTYFGIYSIANNGGHYIGNTVTDISSGLLNAAAMLFINNSNASVLNNISTSVNYHYPGIAGYQGGIVFNNSLNMTIGCNSTDGTRDGLQFFENCDHADIYENSMTNHISGLFYSSPMTVTGVQDNKGNKWPGMTTTTEAHWPNYALGFPTLSLYRVINPAPSDYWPDPLFPLTGWFDQSGSAGMVRCIGGGGGDDFSGDGSQEFTEKMGLSNLEIGILEETINVPLGQETRLFEYKSELYRRLILDPALLNDHQEAGNFYNFISGTNLARFVEIELGHEKVFRPDDELLIQLNQLDQEWEALWTHYAVVNKAFDEADENSEQEELFHAMNEISENIKLVGNEISSVRESMNKIQIDEAIVLLDKLIDIVPNEENEELLKSVFLIKLNDRINDNTKDWTNEIVEQLTGIASLCPFTHGRGVYYARNLLLDDKKWAIFHDDPLCGIKESADFRTLKEGTIESKVWTIVPNPSYDRVRLLRQDISFCDFILYNNLGIAILQGRNLQDTPIDISHLPSGHYWMRVTSPELQDVQILPVLINR